MSSIARTGATGADGMLPELVRWSSSFADDLAFAREDLLGSAAHATMLGKVGVLSLDDARTLRKELLAMSATAARGEDLALPHEEDVHMAVEAALGQRLGPVAQRLHAARSRNDQVALDLRLFARDRAARLLEDVLTLARQLLTRAAGATGTLLPAYTHRQRAQPVSAAFLLCAWTTGLLRAGDAVAFALDSADVCPLGSGACSGSSLPIDRRLVARLLGFASVTTNALDTVGDRDFALDHVWACARVLGACGKLAADVVDFSTSEFCLVRLDGAVSAGSSMMPQKKNPDIFELVRGKAGVAVGDVAAMLALVKGLASGYNRDQQEDRGPLLAAATRARGAVGAVTLALPHVTFDGERGRAALAPGFTQATDLAEELVRRGVAFREAYKAVGELVRRAGEAGVDLAALGADVAKQVHPTLDAAALGVLDPARAIAAKESEGGTGPRSVARQVAALTEKVQSLAARAASVPTLDAIARTLEQEPL